MKAQPALHALRAALKPRQSGIVEIGRFLHSHPETGFKEFQAVEQITGFLRTLGFTVEQPYAGLQTAFRARLNGRGQGRTAAVLAEYDALPALGHACGHNLITVAALSAAAAMAGTAPKWRGRFEIIGTPGEEMLAGKATMIRHGAFQDLAACLLSHPLNRTFLVKQINAFQSFKARFKGRPSHAAAAPWEGINALDAVVLCYNNISALRQQLPEEARIHALITDGGQMLNVIPERAEIHIGFRSPDEDSMPVLRRKLKAACQAAAAATGATVSFAWDRDLYRAFRQDPALHDLLAQGYTHAGLPLEPGSDCMRCSTDMGNVSQVAPSAHPFFSIWPAGARTAEPHTRGFLEQADTDFAYCQALNAGLGMAWTAQQTLNR